MKKFLSLFLSIERDLIVGGQAVIEGVMMRTPSAYAIACRKADGTIVHTAEKLPKWSDQYKFLNFPVIRGGATLIQSMALGVKALNFSANIFEEDANAEKVFLRSEITGHERDIDARLASNVAQTDVVVTLFEKASASRQKQCAASGGRVLGTGGHGYTR